MYVNYLKILEGWQAREKETRLGGLGYNDQTEKSGRIGLP